MASNRFFNVLALLGASIPWASTWAEDHQAPFVSVADAIISMDYDQPDRSARNAVGQNILEATDDGGYADYTNCASRSAASNWTGLYAGINTGYCWTTFDTTVDPIGPAAEGDFVSQVSGVQAAGPLFGGHIGYNKQFDNSWVFGTEANFNGAGASGSKATVVPGRRAPPQVASTNLFSVTDRLDWLADVRLRGGRAYGSNLLYVTGGVAWEGISRLTAVNAEVAPSTYGQSATATRSGGRFGYVVGGGLEHMLTQHWSVRGEYLFYGFEQTNIDTAPWPQSSGAPKSAARITTAPNYVQAFQLGLSYKF